MSVHFRIIHPASPGVFSGPHEKAQAQIIKACESLGIDPVTVTAAGMFENEVWSLDVRHFLAPMNEPMPDDPECDDQPNDPPTVQQLMQHQRYHEHEKVKPPFRTELQVCQDEFAPTFERWAEIQRYRIELARRDAQKAPARQARR